MRNPGYKVRRLAKLLQKCFPEAANGLAVIWRPEDVTVTTGFYRTNTGADTQRWEATCFHIREDGSEYPVFTVQSYSTITSLIKFKQLEISTYGEVDGVEIEND